MSKPTAVHLHQSYWTEPVALTTDNSAEMHQLSVAVNWPHRPEDIAALLRLGQGFLASDEIGRPIGSGMVFSYGPEMAMIGMMMTHPKLQAGGLGECILTALLAQAGTTRMRLNATRSAQRLYRGAGFVETGNIHQYQGIVSEAAKIPFEGLRLATQADLEQIKRCDQETFGAGRPDVIDYLFKVSETIVMCENGAITGFAMCRLFGRGRLIGPLSAPSEGAALALVSHFLEQFQGGFVRLDADARHCGLDTYLKACGLEIYDKVIPMALGGAEGPEANAGRIYALASHTLG